jgi:hypothetical protein
MIMKARNCPTPHQFGNNLEREKSRLEAMLDSTTEGDDRTVVRRKLYDTEAARTMNASLAVKNCAV